MPKKDGFGRFEENFPGCDLTGDEWEFLSAVARYQSRHGRRYPSWREVLTVFKALGYRKVAPETALPKPPVGSVIKRQPKKPTAEEKPPCR